MKFAATWQEIALFLKVDKNQSQKPQSVQANLSRFRIIERWFSSRDWNSKNFRALLASYQEKNSSQGTLNKLITFGKYLDEYFGTEIMKSFKTKIEKVPKIEAILTPQEILDLANLVYPYKKYKEYLNQRQKALIMLLGTTGCRISEALELRWDNLREHPVKSVLFVDTKNGTDREVWLDEEVFSLMKNLPRKKSLVFDSGRGTSLKSQDINNDLKERAKKLGIKKRIYNHLFRHSFATTMLEYGVSDSDVAKICGWLDMDVLLRYKNSQLTYYEGVMKIHPLLQHRMSYQERSMRLVSLSEKLFDPRSHKITSQVIEGKVVLEISQI